MALADYRLCDVCGRKVFYDANLNYEFSDRDNPIPPEQSPRNGAGMKLDYLGDWAVICLTCAKTHECKVVPLAAEGKGEGRG